MEKGEVLFSLYKTLMHEQDTFRLCNVFIQKYVNLLPIIVNIPQNNCKPGQLYSKLFEEVEKIKCWKVKVDCETVQKDRRLQENKRTIETQRKAIQELQVWASVTCFIYVFLSHYYS